MGEQGDRVWDIIEKVGVCMLTTQVAGRLRARRALKDKVPVLRSTCGGRNGWRTIGLPASRRARVATSARYCAVMPPSKVRIVPVAKRLSSLARNRMPAAISSGVPRRPSSCRAANALRAASRSVLFARMSAK